MIRLALPKYDSPIVPLGLGYTGFDVSINLKVSIALVIHSLDPGWGLGTRGFDVSINLKVSIALVIHSLDPGWGLGTRGFDVSINLKISIARDFLSPSLITQLIVIHSLDPRWGFWFRQLSKPKQTAKKKSLTERG